MAEKKPKKRLQPNVSFKLNDLWLELYDSLAALHGERQKTSLFMAWLVDAAEKERAALPKNPSPLRRALVERFKRAFENVQARQAAGDSVSVEG